MHMPICLVCKMLFSPCLDRFETNMGGTELGLQLESVDICKVHRWVEAKRSGEVRGMIGIYREPGDVRVGESRKRQRVDDVVDEDHYGDYV